MQDARLVSKPQSQPHPLHELASSNFNSFCMSVTMSSLIVQLSCFWRWTSDLPQSWDREDTDMPVYVTYVRPKCVSDHWSIKVEVGQCKWLLQSCIKQDSEQPIPCPCPPLLPRTMVAVHGRDRILEELEDNIHT